jgi:hypothetical protein
MLVLIIRFTACHYHGRIDKGISKFIEKVKKYPAVTLSCYQPAVFNLTVDHQSDIFRAKCQYGRLPIALAQIL